MTGSTSETNKGDSYKELDHIIIIITTPNNPKNRSTGEIRLSEQGFVDCGTANFG